MRLYDSGEQALILQLHHGDYLLESIRQAIAQARLDTAIVTSGIGCLKRGVIHTVATNEYPPRDVFLHLEGPLEIVSLQGIIANGEPHLHIALWNWHNQQGTFYGGHLEEGCEILTLAEISLLRVPNLRLIRQPLPESGIRVIVPREG